MLNYLHIENIAVIEEANICFSSGFNVFTGETGAGKSIIIDAIYAVIGHRTSKELIRNGCSSAKVSAVFSALPDEAEQLFAQNDIKADDDGNYIIERSLSLSGNGYIKVNGVPISSSVLKVISPYLVNIHGQHDNQTLLNSENHYIYIDKLAENDELLNIYRSEFDNFNSIRKRLKELEMDEDEKLRKIDLLNYQIKEIEDASLKVGEFDELKNKRTLARNIAGKIKTLESILKILKDEGEDGDGIVSSLRGVFHSLTTAKDDIFKEESDLIGDAIVNVSAAIEVIEEKIRRISSDDYDIEKIEDRLGQLSNLSLKYGKDEETMLKFLNDAKGELEDIIFSDEETERLNEQLLISQEKLIINAKKLSDSREKSAGVFEKQVAQVLKELNMPNVKILVEIKKGRYNKNGCDDIQFLFSANAGENPKPLSKIASGGELSRVMLAIKSILANKDEVNTLIFDEIDSGISGKTADNVGIRLKKLSKSHQIICVTHLAQIAVYGGNHLLINKNQTDGRTYTEVVSLNGENRVKEIARIMGGNLLTDSLEKSAQELLQKGQCIN